MRDFFRLLADGGAYSLPFLIHLYSGDGSIHIRLINDTRPLVWNGETYAASNFTYNPSTDGGASFEVEIAETDRIIDILETSRTFNAEAVGLLYGSGVSELSSHRHKYGDAVWTGKSLRVTFEADDRMDMSFPALTFNSWNNRGNGGV